MIEATTRDRVAAIRWARGVSRDRRAIFLDTETTGLDAGAEIVDIALVSANGTALFNSLVRPERPIPPEASAIHGIADRDVANAPTWPEVASYLETLIAGQRVIVYNADYDSRMINGACRRYGRSGIAWQWECAMLSYAAYRGEPGRRGGYRWHRLDAAATAFGIPPGGHRALEDAFTCRGVVLAMAESPVEM